MPTYRIPIVGSLAAALFLMLEVHAADWASLEARQATLTRERFTHLVATVYSPTHALVDQLRYTTNGVQLFLSPAQTGAPLFELRFAVESADPAATQTANNDAAAKTQTNPPEAPLRGITIMLDPGHIGGQWARMEERFFWINRDEWPVQEGALTLLVAKKLQARLEAAGARVLLTRDGFEPATTQRPEDFRDEAEAQIGKASPYPDLPPLLQEADRLDRVRKRQELLFFRTDEIRTRTQIVHSARPDLTLCIHFNACAWPQGAFSLVDDNRLAIFIHGNFLPEELADEDQLFHLFRKLLEGSHATELAIAESIADALARATDLPSAGYRLGGPAAPIGSTGFVFTRNLAANRLFDGPVVYLEPYFQNNRTVYRRIQAGDYEGSRQIDGRSYRSIFREYADAVADGVLAFFTKSSDQAASLVQ